MNSTFPINPELAKVAARDYLAVLKAGMEYAVDHELREAVESHVACGGALDEWRHGGGWYLDQANEHAARLAELLNCEVEDVAPYLVPELLRGDTRRTLALAAIRDVANRARQQAVKAGRRYA